MSTIWLWDFLPQTDLGKWFFMFYAIIWVPFFVSIWWLILENRFRKSIQHYLKKVYRDLRNAEYEIETVEEAVIKKLKKTLENTEEVVSNIEDVIEKNQKTTWWKNMFKK